MIPVTRPGQILNNRYEIIRNIKTGGMGVVDLARVLETNELCVVKSPLLTDDESDKIKIEKLKTEADILKQCAHPAIVRFIDAFDYLGIFHLVLEFIDGEPLTKRVIECSPPESTIIAWCKQILSALDYLHSFGVIYRDMKPSNIMIRNDARAVLIDFGAAKKGEGEWYQTTATIVTPQYAAPEQIIDNITDARSDIFSMGTTLYFMVTGKTPIRGSSRERIQTPRIFNPNISPWLESIIMKATEPIASSRFQSAKEMLDAIEGQWHGISTPVPPSAPPPTRHIPLCPFCNRYLSFIARERIWYCNRCENYKKPLEPVPQAVPKPISGPRLILRAARGQAPNGQVEFPLTKDNITIGREPESPRTPRPDITVRDEYISIIPKRETLPPGHARIFRDNKNRYWIEDLESTNHTYVNNRMVYGKMRLNNGDIIRLGPLTVFEFREE